MSNLKAYVRYANNKAVAGSLILGRKPPKVGVWQEVPYNLCCDDTCPPCPNFCMDKWTFENFDGTTYRNGDPIPEVTDPTDWVSLTTGAWCYYNNDPANGSIYGKLYNWYAVNDPRGLAPVGYRVPTEADWDALVTCLGSESGTAMKTTGNNLDDTGFWDGDATPPFPFIPGTNTIGFSGLPAGNRQYNAVFQNINKIGYWWSATESIPTDAYYYALRYNFTGTSKSSAFKQYGQSVRLIKDI